MIGESMAADIGIQLVILALSAITPAAAVYHLLYALSTLGYMASSHAYSAHFSNPVPGYAVSIMRVWLATEILFFVYFLNAVRRFQPASRHEGMMDAKQRMDTLLRVLGELKTDVTMRVNFFQGWFYDAYNEDRLVALDSIYRGNAAEWLAFVLFGSELNVVAEDATTRDELYAMVDILVDCCGMSFRDGYNHAVRCRRLNVDPVRAVHRPFLFYIGVWAVDAVCKMVLMMMGFRRHGRRARGPLHIAMSVIAPEADALMMRGDEGRRKRSHRPQLTYWHRPADATAGSEVDRREYAPFVVVHGVGCGLAPYLGFIHLLLRGTEGRAGIILVELPHVAMRMYSHAPSIPRTVFEVARALHRHGYDKHGAIWVGHSLGSAVLAGACRLASPTSPDGNTIVRGCVFVDPICFKLILPDVAVKFLYRRPQRARERFLGYFASRELFTSRYFSRDFYWYHSHVWPEMIPMRSSVFLAEQDIMVPSLAVANELSATHGPQGEQHTDKVNDTKDVGVKWWVMSGIDHAHFLFRGGWTGVIANEAVRLATIDQC